MSTPLHRHENREQFARRGGTYVAARFAQMRCDGAMGACKLPPARAPRLVVPPQPWLIGISPPPLRMMMTLHYCEQHKGELSAEQILVDKVKADFEQVARRKWTHEYRPDFDAAFIEWLLVTTPEYRRFLETIEVAAGPPILGGVRVL